MHKTYYKLLSIILPFAVTTNTALFVSRNNVNTPVYTSNVPVLSVFEKKEEGEEDFEIEYKSVDREEVLKKFLDKYNSPLNEHADTFVETADKYGLDYRLLPAISCAESTCGKFLIPESYNPFGWGGGLIYFNSYDDAIEKVGEGLNRIYLARGLDTIEEIAPVYTPPSYVHWRQKVRTFMSQMDEIATDI